MKNGRHHFLVSFVIFCCTDRGDEWDVPCGGDERLVEAGVVGGDEGDGALVAHPRHAGDGVARRLHGGLRLVGRDAHVGRLEAQPAQPSRVRALHGQRQRAQHHLKNTNNVNIIMQNKQTLRIFNSNLMRVFAHE